jgi:hypothetical protein
MSASTETFDSLGWSPRHMDALPLIDEPLTDEPGAASFHRMHWAAAAVALTLFVLARLDILPAMPW